MSQRKSNQHQLSPINSPQDHEIKAEGDYQEGQCGHGWGCDCSSCGHGHFGNHDNRYDQQDCGGGCGETKRDFSENRGRGQENWL